MPIAGGTWSAQAARDIYEARVSFIGTRALSIVHRRGLSSQARSLAVGAPDRPPPLLRDTAIGIFAAMADRSSSRHAKLDAWHPNGPARRP